MQYLFFSASTLAIFLAFAMPGDSAPLVARHAEPEPDVAFVTVSDAPTYVTQYANGAQPNDPNVQYSTDNTGAQPFYSTEWPQTISPAEGAATTPSDDAPAPPSSQAPAPTTSDAPAPPPPSSQAPAPTTSDASAPPPPPPPSSQTPASSPAQSPAQSPSPTTESPSLAPETSSVTTSPEAPTSSSYSTVLVSTQQPSSPPASSQQPSSSPTSSQGTGGPEVTNLPKYMVYSPYNNDQSCKDAGTVFNDLQDIKNKGIGKVRVYATDCNTLQTVQPALQKLGMTLIQGLWIGTSGIDNVDQSLQDVINSATSNGNSWDLYDYISVGNEDVTNGYVSASDLVQKTKEVKSKLRAAGYNGPVITAEVTDTYQQNTELCDTSAFDVLGLNAHSYFAPTFAPDSAGTFVEDQIGIVSGVCKNGNVFITEAGYPSQGKTNGLNVPSEANQAIAINAIMKAVDGNAVLLAEYNDMWKQPGPYGVEQYFGALNIIS